MVTRAGPEGWALSAQARAALTYGVALLSGAVLFFLCFAAIFNGSWPLLLFFVLCYAAAGALGVQAGRVGAVPLALTLAAPAVPWVLWLFPASIPEAGLLRALDIGVAAACDGIPYASTATVAFGYRRDQVAGNTAIIDALAVTSDPKELARLLGEGAPILWADMPTLPLYRQQRTLLTSKKMYAVSSNPTQWGAGWNMDRWVLEQ